MSFCLRPNVCKKCGKPLTLFEGWTCLECDKARQESAITTAGEGGVNMLKTNWDEVDKQEIAKSVVLLDLFTKIYCRYMNDYERFDDLKFRCDECPFQKENGECLAKLFKNKYAPDYKDFGSMGDL